MVAHVYCMTSILGLFIAFVTVLIVLLINKTKVTTPTVKTVKQKKAIKPLKEDVPEIYDLLTLQNKEVQLKECSNSSSAYEFYISTPAEGVRGRIKKCVFLMLENKEKWIIDYFTKYTNYVVVFPTIAKTSKDYESVLNRIFLSKDSDKGLEFTSLKREWTVVCHKQTFPLFLEMKLPEAFKENCVFENLICLQGNYTEMTTNVKNVVFIDTLYNCQIKYNTFFPKDIYEDNDEKYKRYYYRIQGSYNPTLFSSSCGFHDETCDKCTKSAYIINPNAIKSTSLSIIDHFLNYEKNLQFPVVEIINIKVNKKNEIICLTISN